MSTAATKSRARKGEYVNRIPQTALDEISLQMQEQRETIEHLKTTRDALREALRLTARWTLPDGLCWCDTERKQNWQTKFHSRGCKAGRAALAASEGSRG